MIRVAEGDRPELIFTPQFFDLTMMFGDGNEPTIEQFHAMFPADYYPYSEPTLMSFSSKKVISKGKNLLNIAGRTEIIDTGSYPIDGTKAIPHNLKVSLLLRERNHPKQALRK